MIPIWLAVVVNVSTGVLAYLYGGRERGSGWWRGYYAAARAAYSPKWGRR